MSGSRPQREAPGRGALHKQIDVSDIQGFALKGYNFPHARYLLLELGRPEAARAMLLKLLTVITTGERWAIDNKPMATVNIAFTQNRSDPAGFRLPACSVSQLEFQQWHEGSGRPFSEILENGPDNWDAIWREDRVHAWLAVNARSTEALEKCCDDMLRLMAEPTQGAHA